MEELVSTNDSELIAYVEHLLRQAGIRAFVADQNMSVLEGSLGVLPRRLLVAAPEAKRARQILEEAGVGRELSR